MVYVFDLNFLFQQRTLSLLRPCSLVQLSSTMFYHPLPNTWLDHLQFMLFRRAPVLLYTCNVLLKLLSKITWVFFSSPPNCFFHSYINRSELFIYHYLLLLHKKKHLEIDWFRIDSSYSYIWQPRFSVQPQGSFLKIYYFLVLQVNALLRASCCFYFSSFNSRLLRLSPFFKWSVYSLITQLTTSLSQIYDLCRHHLKDPHNIQHLWFLANIQLQFIPELQTAIATAKQPSLRLL